MRPENLRLYEKYRYRDDPREFIYIGIDIDNDYLFIYKDKNKFIRKEFIIYNKLDFDQIVKDLNLELDKYGYIKDYGYTYSNEDGLQYLKPILKDKLKNIINR